MGRVAALAIAEADLLAYARLYARRCVENAQALAAALAAEGFKVMGEGRGWTHSHHVPLDARPRGGTRLARQLEPANILATGIPLPLPSVTGDFNGVRLGTQEVTRWGMETPQMEQVARLLARAVLHGEPTEAIRAEVIALREQFRTIRYCLGPAA